MLVFSGDGKGGGRGRGLGVECEEEVMASRAESSGRIKRRAGGGGRPTTLGCVAKIDIELEW